MLVRREFCNLNVAWLELLNLVLEVPVLRGLLDFVLLRLLALTRMLPAPHENSAHERRPVGGQADTDPRGLQEYGPAHE